MVKKTEGILSKTPSVIGLKNLCSERQQLQEVPQELPPPKATLEVTIKPDLPHWVT